MAPRAYWKGYLKLSLVSCPIALFPATSDREKISFHQLNKETGNRIRYRKVDAVSGDEVESADIVKGYEVAKGEYIELAPEELDAVAAAYPYWSRRAGSRRHWLPNQRRRRYRSSSRSAAIQSSSAWSPHITSRVETRQAPTSWLPKWMASVLRYCTR